MKKAIIALVALMLLGTTPVFAAAAGTAAEDAGRISVNGEGSVSAMPDMAVLSIGTTTTGETTAVQQENAEIMEKVTAAIKASGVAETDITTDNYSLNPNYDYETVRRDGSNEIIGYTMTHMLKVIVRDVDKAGEVLSAATEAGANQNWGINFDVSNPEEYYNEALAKAIKNAEGKAKVMADTVGVTISKPSEVMEDGRFSVTPYRYEIAMDAGFAGVAEAAAAPVSVGEMKITASVSLTYKY